MMQQDINVEDVLKGMVMVDGAKEYLVLNSEGTLISNQRHSHQEKFNDHSRKSTAFIIPDNRLLGDSQKGDPMRPEDARRCI